MMFNCGVRWSLQCKHFNLKTCRFIQFSNTFFLPATKSLLAGSFWPAALIGRPIICGVLPYTAFFTRPIRSRGRKSLAAFCLSSNEFNKFECHLGFCAYHCHCIAPTNKGTKKKNQHETNKQYRKQRKV